MRQREPMKDRGIGRVFRDVEACKFSEQILSDDLQILLNAFLFVEHGAPIG
jgi:hypothetical protein